MSRNYAFVGGAGILLAAYALVNPLRAEHLFMLGALGVLWLFSRMTRQFVLLFLPLFLFVWLYDLLRVFSVHATHIVSIQAVHQAELALFGWMQDGVRIGPVEYFEMHHHVVLDLLGAVWYSSHILTVLSFTVFLWWSQRRSAMKPRSAGDFSRFLWGFLAINLVGFTIQVLFPVAPPWYVSEFGHAMPSPGMVGDPAGLARVDALFGSSYFAGVYGKASYVFGAMPSLHVAYPVWIALNTRSVVGRILGWSYAAAMAFFAVYLTHHYILDLLAGAGISILVYRLLKTKALVMMPLRFHLWLERQFLESDAKPNVESNVEPRIRVRRLWPVKSEIMH